MNSGPGTQAKMALPVAQDCTPKQPHVPEIKKRKLDDLSSSMDRKKIQYRILAEFVGMGELEFSKWLLSATPMQRQKVLKDYRRRKEKIPNG